MKVYDTAIEKNTYLYVLIAKNVQDVQVSSSRWKLLSLVCLHLCEEQVCVYDIRLHLHRKLLERCEGNSRYLWGLGLGEDEKERKGNLYFSFYMFLCYLSFCNKCV